MRKEAEVEMTNDETAMTVMVAELYWSNMSTGEPAYKEGDVAVEKKQPYPDALTSVEPPTEDQRPSLVSAGDEREWKNHGQRTISYDPRKKNHPRVNPGLNEGAQWNHLEGNPDILLECLTR
jgi:hypothetical protein